MRLPRGLAVLGALAAAICLTAAPADARSCRGGSCAKAAHAKKLRAPAAYMPMKTTRHRAHHCKNCRHTRRHASRRLVWHGWAGDSFYLDGVRYRGGNPRGPAAAYNNWEGGFHPVAFWELHLRSVSGV
jgi:hypothetical protein